jgi:hypothetical protein
MFVNTVETHSEEIFGEEDVCAKLTIDDLASKFCIAKAMKPGEQYTLSFWLKTDSSGSITVCNVNFAATAEWAKYELTFTADTEDLLISFGAVGTYYLYHTQLEVGNVATDWRPAPEDLSEKSELEGLNERVQLIYESVFNVSADGIKSQVTALQESYNKATEDLNGLTGRVSTIEQKADSFELQFKSITDDGVSKFDTGTGYRFDVDGLMVDNTESKTKTQLTFNGMFVYSKSDIDGSNVVLKANDEGVDAANLLARTYLIVGHRSRFENFGDNQTGCFWIGG